VHETIILVNYFSILQTFKKKLKACFGNSGQNSLRKQRPHTIEMIMTPATIARFNTTTYCVMEDEVPVAAAGDAVPVPAAEDAVPVPVAEDPVPAAEDPVAEAEDTVPVPVAEDPVPVPVPQVEGEEDESQLPSLAVKDMHVTIVQDVSGSMEHQRISVATGINEIFGDMKKRYREPCEHKATVRVIKFSSHDNIAVGPVIPISEVTPITMHDLLCDGMTAMWDAVAIAINHMNQHSAGVPATTYIFTDGDNNDSKLHTQSSVNEMIADNKRRNPMHSVLFIGSDPTTRRNAENIGLDRVHSIQHDSANTPMAYEVCRNALGRCVSGDTQSTEFNHHDIAMSETPQHYEHDTPRAPHTPPHHTDSQIPDGAFMSDEVFSRY
jgi:uncharacterized protein YegL